MDDFLMVRRRGALPFKSPPGLHRCSDQAVMADFRPQLDAHVGPGWYAWAVFADGRGISLGATALTPEPPAPVWNRLRSVCEVLNGAINHDGHWIVALSADGEPRLLWRDADGDVHTYVEIDARGYAILDWTEADFAMQADAAWEVTQEQIAKLELTPGQQIKKALGERRH